MKEKKKFAICLLSIGTAVTAIAGGIIALIITMKPVADVVNSNREYYNN